MRAKSIGFPVYNTHVGTFFKYPGTFYNTTTSDTYSGYTVTVGDRDADGKDEIIVTYNDLVNTTYTPYRGEDASEVDSSWVIAPCKVREMGIFNIQRWTK